MRMQISIFSSWRIGYLNQCIGNLPGHVNVMNHILATTYFFGSTEIIHPVGE